MRTCRALGLLLVGALVIGGWTPAATASVNCSKPTKCTNDTVVANVRALVSAACPCSAATKASDYSKCWRPVVKAQVKALGKLGFPSACRTDVKRALGNSTCGRADSILCRKISKKGVETCGVAKAAKCTNPYERVDSTCVDACACSVASKSKRTVGCDYFATSMDVFRHGDCFAAFVVNTSTTAAAHIGVRFAGADLPVESFTRIPVGTGSAPTLLPYDANAGLPPGGAAVLFLGGVSNAAAACPVTPATANSSFAFSGIFHAFEITTDAPVVAYQVNPFGAAAASVTGASLLLPTQVWDTSYAAVDAFAQGFASGGVPPRASFGPSLNIVARENDTVVTVVPTVTVVGGNGVPPTSAGQPFVLDLAKGEHAQITQNTELTGSPITATKPIGLMAGHPCMNVPTNQPDFCDHGEQMIPPVHAFGSTYPGVRYRARAGSDTTTLWRAVGLVDGTQLTYSTAVGGPATLSAKQIVLFQAGTPFVVSSQDAARPFMLFEYMTGSGAVTPIGQGDPDFVVVVPPEQYLDRYLFFTDPTFPETDLVVVRKRDGAGTFHDVVLDCAGTLTGWQFVGNDFQFVRVDLTTGNFQNVGNCTTGVREMHSDAPFGVTVWGWGTNATTPTTRNVSYAYPAGMKVESINAIAF